MPGQRATPGATPGEKPRAGQVSFLRGTGWKLAYFGAGVLFIGLSRFFVPFWPRFIILSVWAIGLALIFIRHLESTK